MWTSSCTQLHGNPDQDYSGVLRHNGAQLPVTLAIHQAQLHRVVLQQSGPLGDGHQCDAELGCMPASQASAMNPSLRPWYCIRQCICWAHCMRSRQALHSSATWMRAGQWGTCTDAPRCPRWLHWYTHPGPQTLGCGRKAAPCPCAAAHLQAHPRTHEARQPFRNLSQLTAP